MLHFILGTDWKANQDEVFRRLKKDVQSGLGGRILIVPELVSHDMERRLCAEAGDTSSRYAEVLSFTRLGRRISDEMGLGADGCLDAGGRVVAMAAAARQLHSRLKAYASVETRPEFLTERVDMVDEFKRCCIQPEDLRSASGQVEGSFAQKLEELSLLLEGYDAFCQRGKRDPRDQMTLILEQLKDGDFGERHSFYMDGFPDLTRQHMEILKHLIRVSPEVTLSLNCDRPGTEKLAFEKAGKTAGEFLKFAEDERIPYEITVIPAGNDPLHIVREMLFEGKIQQTPELKGKLILQRTDSLYEECTAAAERVLRLVQDGCRYRDISIVCSDTETYRDTLRMVFDRCGVPLYQSGNDDVLGKPVITALLTALDAALGGLEQRTVLRYMQSLLIPPEDGIWDEVENYVLMWNISGRRWTRPWTQHPDGLGAVWDEASEEKLNRLENARVRLITPLVHLQNGFRQAGVLSEQVLALYVFLDEIRLQERLSTLAEERDLAGDNRSAQIFNQIWEILMGALEQMYDVLGGTVWDTDSFGKLFALLLSQYQVGTIPTVLDAVTAGPVTAMRCQQEKHLIILGACEGKFPGYTSSSGLFTDAERETLRSLSIPLTGGGLDGIQEEFAEIYGVFCGAEETVAVSCSQGEPSYLYQRLCRMTPEQPQPENLLGAACVSRQEAAAVLARERQEKAAESLGLQKEYAETEQRISYRLGKISPEQIENLYGKKLYLSASKADQQAECRFSYFLKYGLKAEERKKAEVNPAEFGTYIHSVLEHTARKVMEEGGFHSTDLKRTMEIADEYSRNYVKQQFSEIDSPRAQYLLRRNREELQMVVQEFWRELSDSRFYPVGFEVGFGKGREMPEIVVNGKKIKAVLQGAVDRVDVWRESGINYYRVVDYKTGKKTLDYCDLLNGIGLQMLLYLFTLEQEGGELLGDHPVPAGVEYFPARAPFVKADGWLDEEEAGAARESLWKRSGMLLEDEAVVNAMEPDKKEERLSNFVKKGKLSGYVADRNQLEDLKKYVFRILGKLADEIASGTVDPNPYTRGSSQNACQFCVYAPICHPDTVEGRRDYKAVSAQEFWEQIQKEAEKNG